MSLEATGGPAGNTGFRLGIDIGGTFTDIVALGEDGRVHTRKVSSSQDDYARAIIEGLEALFVDSGLSPGDIEQVLHGTTVASNAILEHRGARTGLITTRGFRDVLELRNLRMPRLYDLHWEKPEPLVDRYLRVEVDERVAADGAVQKTLLRAEAERAVDQLVAEEVEAIAVCLINAYLNPVHEQLIKSVIQERAAAIPFSISFEVLPEIKEYERTSTTVINAYVMPVVTRYLETLARQLESHGVTAPLLLMQSNGGLTTIGDAARRPCHIIESGPAGGVVGAQALARKVGARDIITFDMGGTTAKASLIEDGVYTRSQEYSVGAGIMIGSRLLTGAGYQLKVPAIDLAEVGAGGGSIVWIDAGGSLQIGPQSAGANPGPACYDLGGTLPTVTDANLILGYLNSEYLIGGALRLNAESSRRIFSELIADRLGLDLAHAAYGAHQIAASNMIRAIRAVSIERGRDPRGYTLFAFGGNGPLFACTMASSLGMKRVVVPPSAGLFSSFGLLYAEVEHHYSRTLRRVLREADPNEIDTALRALEEEAQGQLASEGFTPDSMRFPRTASLHYQGQIYELEVPVSAARLDTAGLRALEESFGQEHERTYGHRAGPDEPVELVNIHVVGQGISARTRVPETVVTDPGGLEPLPSREAYFGPDTGWLESRVLHRPDLSTPIPGPCIVEEYDATCLVPPGATISLDNFANMVIELT